MLETAMLKVCSPNGCGQSSTTPSKSTAAPPTLPIAPLERMLRDHRINQIGEEANEVLLSFIALVGMRGPGARMKEVATR